jgi:protein phosphatase
MPTCPQCGSASNDPAWCDTCGAELSAVDRPRLAHGDQLAFLHTENPDDTPAVFTITLAERIAAWTTRQVWMAIDEARNIHFRVEEFDGDEDDPDALPVLAHLVDIPVATTRYNERLVHIFRHTEGELLAQRLEHHQGPLSVDDIVEWMDPVFHTIEAIHSEGYVCLKLCPFTIKFRPDGSVFLQNTAGLYRADTLPTSLPALLGYTAPEIYSSDFTAPPGASSDVFSLAMTIYYLVTRRDPPVSMYTSWTPAVAARDIVPTFPVGFQPLFAFAAAVSPEDRPASVSELRGLLQEAALRVRARQIQDPELKLSVAAETHPGIFKRNHQPINQDAVFSAVNRAHDFALIAVADGVSTASYGTGDLASSLALNRIRETWAELEAHPRDVEQQGPERLLTALLQSINYDIVEWINQNHTPFHGEPSEVMGTTAVIALAHNGTVTIASLGDSRAYLIRDNHYELITRDHNLATLGIIEGMDVERALMLPQGDALARCIGLFDLDDENTLTPHRLRPDVYEFNLRVGDRLLLCTDGLTDFAGQSPAGAELAIFDVVRSQKQPEMALVELAALANRGGGGDNIGLAMLAAEDEHLSISRWLESRRSAETFVLDSED